MKKLLTLLASILTILNLQAQGSIEISGTAYPIDTTMHYQAGPGVWHTRYTIDMNGTKHNCYILEVDMTNSYNHVEEYSSGREMGKHETLATTHSLLDAPNHRTIGAVNCNFWIAGSTEIAGFEGLLGHVFAATANNGVLISQPDDWDLGAGDRGFVMIDDQKRVHIEDMTFAATVTTNDNQSYTIREMNRPRWYPYADEISIFNHYMGSQPTRATDGVELVFTTNDWNINDDMTCTVHSFNYTGGTVISEGMGTLQGRGTGKTFLESLKVGDTFKIHLGIVSTHDATYRPNIMEMVTGNCLVMRDGELTYRNTNEDYNSRVYPRTMLATNKAGNRLWMMVAEKPGFSTAQMCEILRHGGATMAAGMDGGGSAQMFMDGHVINPTTEGTPRKLPNSLWVFSTAPDDSVVTRISTQAKEMRLPKYGVYDPTFVSYNQYDVLISLDQPGVVLSCPDSTGYIGPNGEFVCLGNGTLTATYGEATTTVDVKIVETSGISMRLDSVLVMDDSDYAIEVIAHTANTDLGLLSGALTWRVEDETICTIDENGVLNGLQNGRTKVYGTLNGVTDELIVNVEIPNNRPYLVTDMNNINEKWNIATSPSTLNKNTKWQQTQDGKAELWMNYTQGRGANTYFTIEQEMYALPTFIEIRYQSEEFPLDKIAMDFHANNTPKDKMNFTIEAENMTFGGPANIVINVKELIGQGDDIAIYPITWEYMKFFYDTSREKKEYSFVWDGIYLHYGSSITLGTTSLQPSAFAIYPNPTADMLHIRGIEKATNVTLYDLKGRMIVNKTLMEDGTININNLTEGTYLLQVGNETMKVIKK